MASSTNAPRSSRSDGISVGDLMSSLQHFEIVDYAVLVVMLLTCATIGFYFGFIEKKGKNRKVEEKGSEELDYLVGGRQMRTLPIALSLVASTVSGISLLGNATEVYVYGTKYTFMLITYLFSGLIIWHIFLPVFCNLQLTSAYEYLEMRFDNRVRLFGSILFSIATMFWLPIVIYAPALVFNQITGVNIHVVSSVMCVVCIFYTCVGGMKAVVWTDVIQTITMVGAILLIAIKVTYDVGGLDVIWRRNFDTGRIEAPEITLDPTERVSFFSVFFGSTIFYVYFNACNQSMLQRYLSLPSVKEANKALIYFTIFVVILLAACYYNGLVIFANYFNCDPLSTGLAKLPDQLLPLLVMDRLRYLPGIPGLFVAAVLSAALSSLSTGLNSLAAVFLEDYIKPLRKTDLTERQTAIIMRVSVVVLGILSVALVLLVEKMGTVLQLSITLNSVASGPLLGIFLVGLLLPWINGNSTLIGGILSLGVMALIAVEGQLALASGELAYVQKPVTTQGCNYDFEERFSPVNQSFVQDRTKSFAQYIFHISFMYYALLGVLLTTIFAGLATLFFGRNDSSTMNLSLYPPCIKACFKQSTAQI